MTIRNATRADLPALVRIFNDYVNHGHVTFDTESTTVEREDWFTAYGDGRHQLIVAARRDQILGYSSSSSFRSHRAFDTTVETSIYLDPAERGHGTGTCLCEELFARLRTHRVHCRHRFTE
jgi:phosphinothricin acetyltransferase